MHGIWDMSFGNMVYVILIVFAWIILLVLINVGLKEINQIDDPDQVDVGQDTDGI